MSITIDLMQNLSDTNVVDKSLSTLASVNGVLKESTSVITPTLIIQNTLPPGCNYLYISDFARYYYVTDVRSIHNDIFEISAHVDVLKTYASQLRNCSGIVARQENKYNLYLDDGSFKTYQNPKFKKLAFPEGFTTLEFVLAVAGRQ